MNKPAGIVADIVGGIARLVCVRSRSLSRIESGAALGVLVTIWNKILKPAQFSRQGLGYSNPRRHQRVEIEFLFRILDIQSLLVCNLQNPRR